MEKKQKIYLTKYSIATPWKKYNMIKVYTSINANSSFLERLVVLISKHKIASYLKMKKIWPFISNFRILGQNLAWNVSQISARTRTVNPRTTYNSVYDKVCYVDAHVTQLGVRHKYSIMKGFCRWWKRWNISWHDPTEKRSLFSGRSAVWPILITIFSAMLLYLRS